MELALVVTVEGSPAPVDVTVELSGLDTDGMMRAIEICGGIEPLVDLAGGHWNDRAAAAIMQVAAEAKLGMTIDTMTLDWGELTDFMAGPDLELEASIPMEPESS